MRNISHIHTRNFVGTFGGLLVEAFEETLWPTRCAICDSPGTVLCDRCQEHLPYIDYWRACPRCGAPFGFVQCTECNPVMLTGLPDGELPYASCRSPFSFDDGACRIVTAYKDQGEQRLAPVMARFMAQMMLPGKNDDAYITFIPATRAALRRRGFDHGNLLANHVATALNGHVIPLLDRPVNKDQRILSRNRRFENMGDTFSLTTEVSRRLTLPEQVLLVDDVCTTGATLAAASAALIAGGVRHIDCLTFARVW